MNLNSDNGDKLVILSDNEASLVIIKNCLMKNPLDEEEE